jgi:hypothetical protein
VPHSRNTKGESITVLLTSCLTGLDLSVLKIKTKLVNCHTASSKKVKQEVNRTMILPKYSLLAPTYRTSPGNTKGGSITVLLTSCLTCLD